MSLKILIKFPFLYTLYIYIYITLEKPIIKTITSREIHIFCTTVNRFYNRHNLKFNNFYIFYFLQFKKYEGVIYKR